MTTFLKKLTTPEWTQHVLNHFDEFLIDHAACERKASASALHLVSHYPDRKELVRAMISLAQEELDHFAKVYFWMEKRNLKIGADTKDFYINTLQAQARKGGEFYLLDRLLLAGIIEARGCERFGLVAEALEEKNLKDFYQKLTRSEERHHELFIQLAKTYYREDILNTRLEELLTFEAHLISALPLKAAVH